MIENLDWIIVHIKMKNKISTVWCYVLYGRDTLKYFDAMHHNIILAENNGARVVICTLSSDEPFVREYFKDYLSRIDILSFDRDMECKYPKFLRYLVPLLLSADYYFYKDSDSIVTQTEIRRMNEWVSMDNTSCLIFRDHPLHVAPILGGMFSLKKSLAKKVACSLNEMLSQGAVKHKDPYLYDQLWLSENVYPLVHFDSIVYTSHLFYFGENYRSTREEWDSINHIGAQHFELEGANKKLLSYEAYYDSGLLSLPFFKDVAVIYQRARIVIFAAVLLRFLKVNG